jgi:cytochrome c oxidase subunit 2
MLAAPERRRRFGSNGFIIGGGIVFPMVTLTVLLAYGLSVSARDDERPGTAPLRIDVIAQQWWWRVRYLDDAGELAFVTANEIRIPVGRPIELTLTSGDVIHSFWAPNLAGKLDAIPGIVNRLRLQADAAGVFRGQCAEFCGPAHALHAFYVVAQTPEEFAAWFERQRQPARPPDTAVLRRGRELFLANGCGGCHTVRGTPAGGTIGPDLTHVGGRRSLAGGILPNNAGTMAGWIADSQTLKPGNHMPSFKTLDGESLRALAAYLESLE